VPIPTINPPNTILLGGGEGAADGAATFVNDIVAIEAITPGMLLRRHDDSGTAKWGVHDSADAAISPTVALEQVFLNQGIDDPYAIGDLVLAAILKTGSVFYGIIPSGQNISIGENLQSNGDGKLKAAASGSVRFMSLDGPGAVTEDTRIRVEVQ
jgi:hypothetical protein